MSNVVIKVENLSKKYVLSHQKQERYTALRDVVTNGLKNFGKRMASPFFAHSAKNAFTDSQEEFYALRDVSFEIKQGDRVGIIGRNGAGKSTLLKILSRITEPSSGRVTIDGRVASLLEVGTGFHPELTGRENIYLNGAILGMSRVDIKRRFDEIVSFAEVEKFLDTPVKRYSSGMYVRLAFAVAAHLEPEILVIDEVLAVGDSQFQKKCLGKMEDVGREGRTLLFVSHNITAIRALCSRALLLKQGQLISDDLVVESVSKYLSELRDNVIVQEWTDGNTAPHNGSVVLRKISVCDDDGLPLEHIYTDASFSLMIDYEIKSEGSSAGFTLLLYDNESNLVFSSINNHESNWYGKPMPVGDYRSTCAIPANLLNNGWFAVSLVMFGMNFSDIVTVQDALKVEILDGTTVRGDYFGHYGGVFRPMLSWDTRSIKK